jgi:undecaprenyl diphosphate synthase
VPKLQEKGIALEIIGDIWLLPLDIRNILFDAVDATKDGKKMTCILALGYSGQDEIVR